MDKKHAQLIAAMTEYDKGDARRIQHFMKVHDYAVTIATLEGMDESILSVLETTAILHDIGIHVSERKYGSSAGHYQELEGPAEARKLLDRLGGYTEAETDRVCYSPSPYLPGHQRSGLSDTGRSRFSCQCLRGQHVG